MVAEADIIKSQKQPLLLTPRTNLSSAGYAFRCIAVLNGPPALHVPRTFLVTTRPSPSPTLRVPPHSRITVPELRHCSGLFGDLWILLPPHPAPNFHGPLLPTVCSDRVPAHPTPSYSPQDLSILPFRHTLSIFPCSAVCLSERASAFSRLFFLSTSSFSKKIIRDTEFYYLRCRHFRLLTVERNESLRV